MSSDTGENEEGAQGRVAHGSVRVEPARRRLGPLERAARSEDDPASEGAARAFSRARSWATGWIVGFGYAFSGLRQMLETEPHARFHLAATALVATLAATLGFSVSDWRWLLTAIALVWIAEAFNTAIEALADRITEERDPLIKRAKDVAAGGVLVAAILAAAIGGLTFWPHLAPLLF